MDVVVENLTKSFGYQKAVDSVSFEVKKGEILGFLGPNGAGKTTTLKIMSCFLFPDYGNIRIGKYSIHKNPYKIKQIIGYLPEHNPLYEEMNVIDFLDFIARVHNIPKYKIIPKVMDMIRMCGLDNEKHKTIRELSKGYRQRVGLAQALIHDPEVLLLDEPTTGLDPQTRQNVWNAIETLRRRNNMTVFLTTHYMEEANRADDVVILDGGRIAAQGSPVALKNRYSCDHIRLYGERSAETEKKLAGLDVSYSDNRYSIRVKDSAEAKAVIAKYGDALTDFEVVKGDMDDVFLNVTGKKLTGGEHA